MAPDGSEWFQMIPVALNLPVPGSIAHSSLFLRRRSPLRGMLLASSLPPLGEAGRTPEPGAGQSPDVCYGVAHKFV